MAVGTVSGIDPADNWQLIGTNTPSAAASSTFSSVSGYKKLWLVFSGTRSNDLALRLTFNSDSTVANYGGSSVMYDGASGDWANNQAYIPFIGYIGEASKAGVNYAIIDYANTSAPKLISTGGARTTSGTGIYIGGALTSVSLSMAAGSFTGTLYLYGIAG